MTPERDTEARFAIALVRLLKYFNLLELNVGLCLSFIENPDNPKASYPVLSRITTEQKIERLSKLLHDAHFAEDPGASERYETWRQRAKKARYIRNRYVHGHWDYFSSMPDMPVCFRAPPWMRQKLGADAAEQMSLAQLEEMADEMGSVFGEFMAIRQKLGR